MNVLIVTPYFPYPLNCGGNQAQYHMIDRLRSYLNIHLVYPGCNADYEKHLAAVWPNVSFHPYKRTAGLMVRDKVVNFISKKMYRTQYEGLDFRYGSEISDAFVEHLSSVIRDCDIDLMQVDFYRYLFLGFAFPDVKKIFIQHEIGFIKNERIITLLGSSGRFKEYQYNKLMAEEIAAMNSYDAVATLTNVDLQVLRDAGVSTEIYSSPAIIPCEQELDENYEFNKILTFLGGAGHQPNLVGLEWFLHDVWPTVLAYDGRIKLHVIGNWSANLIAMYKGKCRNIEFLGYVDDLNLVISNTVMVVPILVGSGMRMKIIEAGNYGVPFVTTTVGVEGLPYANGIDCLIADGASAFAENVIRLIADSELCKLLRRNSYDVTQMSFSPAALAEIRCGIYSKICGAICGDSNE